MDCIQLIKSELVTDSIISNEMDEYKDNFEVMLESITEMKSKELISKQNQYIIEMGFQKMLQPNFDDTLENEVEIILEYKKFIMESNVGAFHKYDYSKLNHNVVIDGTCAVGKSTIGNYLKNFKLDLNKTNKLFKTYAINSNPLCSSGYLFTSLKLINERPNSVWDRMPTNNLFWNRIWLIIVKNMNESEKDLDFNVLNTILNTIDVENLKIVVNNVVNILLINSDEKLCKERLYCRGTGNDRERAGWKNYIKIQNYSYLWIAKKFHLPIIDVANFKYLTCLQKAIAQICSEQLKLMDNCHNNNNNTNNNNGRGEHELHFTDLNCNKNNRYYHKKEMLKQIIEAPLKFESRKELHKEVIKYAIDNRIQTFNGLKQQFQND